MKVKLSYKFFIGFLIIFLLGFVLINYFVGQHIGKSNENIISADLVRDRDNLNIYIRQYFLIKNIAVKEEQFAIYSRELIDELKNVSDNEIALYGNDGSLINASNREIFLNSNREDLKNALDNKASFTIKRDKVVKVYFSYPVVVNDVPLGVISIAKDYSALYDSMDALLRFILYLTAFIFGVIFIFSMILSKSITVPIVKLSKASKDIAKGNFDSRLSIKSKDEIGELSVNFFNMVDTLKEQIETIKNDRDKLKELSSHRKQFFDNVTHELKTPLTTILGYAEMLRDNGASDEEFFYKGTTHIKEESKRLHNMVVKLLELSKEEQAESRYDFDKVNLKDLLIKSCEDMSFKGNRYNTKINCMITEDLYTFGNKDRLKEVFINLIDNSIKYGRPGNLVTVDGYRKDRFIYIKISDKGIGMDKEQLGMLFEPFYRADKKKSREIGSCGLGLSIVQIILNSHEGEIQFESVPNEGTTAVVKLIDLKNLQV